MNQGRAAQYPLLTMQRRSGGGRGGLVVVVRNFPPHQAMFSERCVAWAYTFTIWVDRCGLTSWQAPPTRPPPPSLSIDTRSVRVRARRKTHLAGGPQDHEEGVCVIGSGFLFGSLRVPPHFVADEKKVKPSPNDRKYRDIGDNTTYLLRRRQGT